MVPVLAFRNPRFGNIDGYLPAFFRFQKLGKATAHIHVHFQIKRRFFFGQIAQIRRIQFLCKTTVGNFGNYQRFTLSLELIQQVHNFPKRNLMGNRRKRANLSLCGRSLQAIWYYGTIWCRKGKRTPTSLVDQGSKVEHTN